MRYLVRVDLPPRDLALEAASSDEALAAALKLWTYTAAEIIASGTFTVSTSDGAELEQPQVER